MGLSSLTRFEREFLRAIEIGEIADFTENSDQQNNPIKIRGELIRHLLLGIPLPIDNSSSKKKHYKVSSNGIHLKDAIIEGSIDISDCSGAEGNGCAPLILENCELTSPIDENDDSELDISINAKYGKYRRLSLINCKAKIINLTNATICSDLKIIGLESVEDNTICMLDLRGVRIEGGFDVSGSMLNITNKEIPDSYGKTTYALNLTGAIIEGSLYLRKNFHAEGGVSVERARIKGDIWGEGAHLIAKGKLAFFGQSVEVGGYIVFRSIKNIYNKENRPELFVAEGGISLFGAKCAFLDLSGAYLKRSTDTDNNTFVCMYAEIKQSVLLCSRREDKFNKPFYSECNINLYGSNIGANINLIEAKVDNLTLTNVTLGGNLIMQNTKFNIIHANGLHVSRNVSWSGQIRELCDFSGAKIEGECQIGTNKKDPLNIITGQTSKSTIKFDDAKIVRDFKINGIKVLFISNPEWADKPLIGLRYKKLSCYKDLTVIEAVYLTDYEENTYAVVSLYNSSFTNLKLLDGRSDVIHNYNKSIDLQLENEQQAEEYLKFFCGYIKGEEGAFRIIDSKDELLLYIGNNEINIPDISTIMLEKNDKSWKANAHVLYDGKLFKTLFHIDPKGLIEMVEDELIVDLSEHISIRYGNIARFGKIKFTEEATNKINANPKDINIYNSLVPPNLGYSSDWSMKPANQAKNISTSIRSMIEKKNDSNNLSTGQMPVVSLNGLSVGVLDDEHGKRWGDSIKLNLEGFRYDQFESSEMSLASTYRENELKGFLKKEKEGLEKLIWPIIFIWKFISYKLASNSPVWKNRINWIKKQYDNNSVKSEDYRPQPFEQVANVFRKQGNHYYSSKVLVEKLRLERRTLYSIPKQFGLWIWDKFFGYGIFWGPTLKTFLLCWLIGWISVDIANNGYLKWPPLGSIGAPLSSSIYLSQPVLVIDATSVSTFALTDDAKGDDGNILAKEPVTLSPDGRYVKEIRCGDQIEPALYALDVFVPLLDLNQESKCTISSAHNAWPWRIGKSLYTILGWIVTSALILTITGVVRRQVER